MADNIGNNVPRAAHRIQRANSHRRASLVMPWLGSSRKEPYTVDSATGDAAKMTDEGAHSSRPTLTQDSNRAQPKSTTPYKDAFHPSKSRGGTWESFSRSVAEPVQSAFQHPPLRKTGLLDGQKPRGIGDLHHRASSPGDSRANYEQNIGLSRIQNVYEQSPSTPPASLGPQSGQITPATAVESPKPPSPNHNGVPKYISAFEHAMRPYLDLSMDDSCENLLHLPPPEEDSDSEAVSSPLLLPAYNDEDDHYDSEDEPDEAFGWGIPEQLLENDGFLTRIRQVQLQTYLMHCTVLQNTIRELQRAPWIRDAEHSTIWYYEKMRSLAYKALQIAEMLDSRELKARCEYWAGRACGGTQDYQQAGSHFKAALLHDVKNGVKRNGYVQLRGLRPSEKADVRFLRNSCKVRHTDCERQRQHVLQLADRLSWETGLPIEACIDESMLSSSPWVPDRDRIVELAKHQYDGTKGIDEEARLSFEKKLGQALEEQAQAQWKAEDETVQAMHRRTLSREEWRYIKRDVKAAQQHASIQVPEQASTLQSELHKHVLKQTPVASSQSSRARDGAVSKLSPHKQLNPADVRNALNIDGYSSFSVARSGNSLPARPQNSEKELGGNWDNHSPFTGRSPSQGSPQLSRNIYSQSHRVSPRIAEDAESALTGPYLEPSPRSESTSPHSEQDTEEAEKRVPTSKVSPGPTTQRKLREVTLSPIATNHIRVQTHLGSAMQGELAGEEEGENVGRGTTEQDPSTVVEVNKEEYGASAALNDAAAASPGIAATSFEHAPRPVFSSDPSFTTPATLNSTSSSDVLPVPYSSPALRRTKTFSSFPPDAPPVAHAPDATTIVVSEGTSQNNTASDCKNVPHVLPATAPLYGRFPLDEMPANPVDSSQRLPAYGVGPSSIRGPLQDATFGLFELV